MNKLITLLTVATVSFSIPVSAELKDYATAGGWSIYSDEHDCTMSTEYNRNGEISLDYDQRKASVTLRFEVPQTRSLDTGDVRNIKVIFTDGAPGTFDDGWGSTKFYAFKVNNRTFLGARFTEPFLNDLSRYKLLGLFYGDTILSSYDLSGSGAAVTMLKRCAANVSRNNPSDPFDNKTI